MNEIKTAIGKDDRFTSFFGLGDDGLEVIRLLDLLAHAKMGSMSSLRFQRKGSQAPPEAPFVQMFAGFAWSGLVLCASNFIYDAVTPPKRVRCISYFNVINGTALFLGATAGGFLASRLPAMQGYSLLSLFALSGLCRLFFYLILFRRFQEVRPSKEVSIQELFFSVVGVRPLIGVSRD